MLAAIGMVPGVTAHVDTSHAEDAPLCGDGYVQVDHVGPACATGDGFLQVRLADGTVLTTHGPDPLPPPGDIGFAAGDEMRQPVCTSEWHMRVLYGHPPGQDRSQEVLPDLRDAIWRMNAVLNADALESGDVEADYKVRCDADGQIRIDTFQGPETGGNTYTADFAAVVDAARADGHTDARSDYLIFYDDSSDGVCGVGNLARDDSLSADNANLHGPDYGVAYESCWFGRTPMHENGHTQGAVQALAPDWDGSGHCLEGIDVMCYPTQSILVFCSDRTHFDCDHDTYFDAAPEPGEWLETHWNLGSRLNAYIAFADTFVPEPEGAATANGTADDPAGNGEDGAPDGNASAGQDPEHGNGTTDGDGDDGSAGDDDGSAPGDADDSRTGDAGDGGDTEDAVADDDAQHQESATSRPTPLPGTFLLAALTGVALVLRRAKR